MAKNRREGVGDGKQAEICTIHCRTAFGSGNHYLPEKIEEKE